MGYMPTVSHWGYNGNARRYWDFQFDGKISRIERQIHHYGSALNALPMLGYFRSYATASLYQLRVAFGGMFAPLTNIQKDGFGSTAFHSWADTLAWEVYSGDYGPAFLGMVLGSATYVVEDKTYGLMAFGGSVSTNAKSKAYTVTPRDALRKRLYLDSQGMYIELDYGAIQSAEVSGNQVTLMVVQKPTSGAAAASEAILWVERSRSDSMSASGANIAGKGLKSKRGGWAIPLGSRPVSVTLKLK